MLYNNLFEILGKVYRYFYAISSDVDADNPGTVSVLKILLIGFLLIHVYLILVN